jgi:lysophospholipase
MILGQGDHFAKLAGEKPYDFNRHSDCASADGHEARRCKIEELVAAHPETASGGSSYRWAYHSLVALRGVRAGLAAKIKTPLLIFQAGKDVMVRPGGQDAFCALAPNCVKRVFPESTHELLTERDELRGPAINEILEFFGAR